MDSMATLRKDLHLKLPCRDTDYQWLHNYEPDCIINCDLKSLVRMVTRWQKSEEE